MPRAVLHWNEPDSSAVAAGARRARAGRASQRRARRCAWPSTRTLPVATSRRDGSGGWSWYLRPPEVTALELPAGTPVVEVIRTAYTTEGHLGGGRQRE
jgi:hypothetical protein